jgi:hypothetical protein
MEHGVKRKQPEKLMSKLLVRVVLGALPLALSFPAEAQQPTKKVPRSEKI